MYFHLNSALPIVLSQKLLKLNSKCVYSGLCTCTLANSSQVGCAGSLVYMMTLLWIRVRIFLFVKRSQASIIMSPKIRPSIFIGKEHQDHCALPHLVKFIITYLICSLINCMVSWVVVWGPDTISFRNSKFTSYMMVIISIFAHKGVSTAIIN
jgi:hypothetical protein